MASGEVSGKFEKYCKPCEKEGIRKKANVFCQQCDQFQCTNCSKLHEKFEFMSGHDILPASDVKTGATARKADLKGLDKCKKHRKMFEFYCVDHKRLCCGSCVVDQHRKCEEVTSIQEQSSVYKSDARKTIENLEQIRLKSIQVKRDVSEIEVDTSKQIAEIPKKITAMQSKLTKALDELKNTIEGKAIAFGNKSVKPLLKNAKACEDIEKRTSHLLASLKSIFADGSPSDVFIAAEAIQSDVDYLFEELNRISSMTKRFDIKVEFDPALTALLEGKGSLGILQIDKRDETCASPVKPMTLTLMTSLDVKATGDDKKEPLYTGLAFLPDGRLVVVDATKFSVYVMNEKLEKLGVHTFDRTLCSVAVVSDDQVVVTSGTLLYILRVNSASKISVVKKAITESAYYSICLKNSSIFVVGTYDDIRPVRLINVDGTESDIDGLPKKKYNIYSSNCAYIRKTDMLVVSDRLEHAVFVYDINQNYVTSRRVVKDDVIREPRGVTEGPDGTIVLCSESMEMLVQLSCEGKVIATFELDMNYPQVVNVSSNGTRLAVFGGSHGKLKLQLFSIQ